MLRKKLPRIIIGDKAMRERGIQTLEWVGLSAVILTLLLGMLNVMPASGQAIGAQMHSTISNWVEIWSTAGQVGADLGGSSLEPSSGGGRVSSHSDSGLSQGGSPLGGAPGLAPPGGPVGHGLGASSTDQGHVPQDEADSRPGWRRALDRLWARVFGPVYAAEGEQSLEIQQVRSQNQSQGSGWSWRDVKLLVSIAAEFGKASERFGRVFEGVGLFDEGITLVQDSNTVLRLQEEYYAMSPSDPDYLASRRAYSEAELRQLLNAVPLPLMGGVMQFVFDHTGSWNDVVDMYESAKYGTR